MREPQHTASTKLVINRLSIPPKRIFSATYPDSQISGKEIKGILLPQNWSEQRRSRSHILQQNQHHLHAILLPAAKPKTLTLKPQIYPKLTTWWSSRKKISPAHNHHRFKTPNQTTVLNSVTKKKRFFPTSRWIWAAPPKQKNTRHNNNLENPDF